MNHLDTLGISKCVVIIGCKLDYILKDYVFDGSSSNHLLEYSPAAPINYYGRTKRNGEIAVNRVFLNVITKSIRASWSYLKYGRNFVETMRSKLINEGNDQIALLTHAGDLARFVRTIIDTKRWVGGMYELRNAREIFWYDFAYAIGSFEGFTCDGVGIPTENHPTPARHPKYLLLNTSKIAYNLLN